MRTSTRALMTAAAVALLAACGGQGDTATVEPGSPTTSEAPATTPAVTELSISVSEGEQAAAAAEQTYRLTCDPAGGDHPDPEAACAVLDEVGADAFTAPPKDQMCTEQYGGPQTATVTGTVAGQAVQATFDRTDGCAIGRWDALAPVLGAEVGGPDS